MSDTSLRDAALAELKLVTAGWLKPNGQPRYPNGPPAGTHWANAMTSLSQISTANATPRNAAVAALKKTTKGYSATGANWKAALAELAKIANAAPPPPMAKPSAPTGLTAVGADKKITLRWSANPAAEAVDVYQVYEPSAELSLAASGLTYVVTEDHLGQPLVNGQEYGFRISAHNAQGYGPWGAVVNATPTGAPPPPPPPPGVFFPSSTLYPSEVSP